MNPVIRRELPGDYFAAELVARRAFWNLHCPGCDEHFLIHRLRESDCYIPELSRVAECDGKIVGGIYYSRCHILDNTGNRIDTLTFGPLCVDPDYQNKGIGSQLLRTTMELAREMGHKAIIIFGEPDYYPRFGFVTCDKFGITAADGSNCDAFMGIELVPDAFEGICGRFLEPDVYSDLPAESVDEFDRQFPYMEKLVLPGQWR